MKKNFEIKFKVSNLTPITLRSNSSIKSLQSNYRKNNLTASHFCSELAQLRPSLMTTRPMSDFNHLKVSEQTTPEPI